MIVNLALGGEGVGEEVDNGIWGGDCFGGII